MRVLCGGWFEPRHDPITLGEKEPLEDPRISHGICPACEAEFLTQDAKEENNWV